MSSPFPHSPEPRPDGVIFDLDGTLWDSTRTVRGAWNRALRRLGDPRRITAAEVAAIMGRTHAEIRDVLFPGLPDEAWERVALACYREEERALHARGGRLYPGVAEGLAALQGRYRLFIVSNCQQGYIESFLAWSGLRERFVDFECHGNTGASKAENLDALRRRNGLNAPLYVGDTAADRRAAEAAGLGFCHVSYGFGEAGPGCPTFARFAKLAAWLLGEGAA